jgi:GDPmannose 4,6-dehydratase
MWRIVQQDSPGDYVIATGRTHSVREFCTLAFAHTGTTLQWRGAGVDEHAIDTSNGEVLVRVDPTYFRPTEVELLHGDASLARRILGWEATTQLDELVRAMVDHDLEMESRVVALRDAGFEVAKESDA